MSEANKAAELVEFLAKGIVSEPDDVKAKVCDDGVIELETDDDDRGRVIGRQGRVAKALRSVLGASRHGQDARLEIVD